MINNPSHKSDAYFDDRVIKEVPHPPRMPLNPSIMYPNPGISHAHTYVNTIT